MTKESENTNQHSEWEFPEIDSYSEYGNDELISDDDMDMIGEEDDVINADVQRNRQHKSAVMIEKELAIQKLEAELNNKNELLTKILTKIQSSLVFFDDQLINIVQDLIKRIAIKVIHKEIDVDPSLIMKMIENLKSLINDKNGLINIFISEHDYNLLKISPDDTNYSAVKIDKNLVTSDIIIKSNDTEIRAILNDRVDLLMGTLHD